MPIPDYQTLMLPLLQLTGDGKEHVLAEAAEAVSKQFHLSDAERNEMLPSGGQLKLFSRIGWSRTYMAKAGLLETVSRGIFKITARGTALLQTKPAKIDVNLLNQYPEFVGFRTGSPQGKPNLTSANGPDLSATQQTPQELLEGSYQTLHHQIAEDLLEKISKSSPRFFEKLGIAPH